MPDPLNMASSGKKGKKSKGKTLALNDFLQETPGTPPAIPIRKPTTNWADEVEDSYDAYEGRSAKPANVILPTAPKAARGLEDYNDKIPQNPPFMAYLSNLPYDVDEDEIADFFRNLKIISMRIPKEERVGEGTRVKGFGYVEFEDQESLREAIFKPTSILKGRRIRIEVATYSENDRRRGGGRMDMNRERSDRPEVSTGDWRSGGRKEPESSERRTGFNREYNRDRGEGGGFNREREAASERPGAWRDSSDRPSFRDSDKGMTREGQRDRYERDGDRRGFGPRRMDREERNGGFNRESDQDRGEARRRPKLNLAPRTVPKEGANSTDEENQQPKPAPVPAASIFGSAKPVDTTIRERQIEERLAKQHTEIETRREDDRRKDDRDRRRYSPPRRSPDNRRNSPEMRRGSPEPRKGSQDRKRSPEHRRNSLDRKRNSPERKRGSPDRRRASPERRRASPDRKRGSPERRRGSPDRRRGSPDKRRNSPDRKRSPDKNRGPPIRRNDDRKGPPRNEKGTNNKTERERRPPREYTERDMPKLKTPEPVNIVNKNQYAFLESDSD